MIGNQGLLEYLPQARRVAGHRPWPRYQLDEAGWRHLIGQLGVSDWELLGLWAEAGEVHCALRDERTGDVAVTSLPCLDRFPAISPVRPAAARLERAIHDLYGLMPEGLEDRRPWLDHGRWPRRHPLAAGRAAPVDGPYRYRFLPVEGDGLHQVAVGPVHAGIIEPGHFRFHAAGETVVRLEQRFGYQHKGIESLMAGKTVAEAARLAGRVSGDSTVAYAIAFARAVEAASGAEAPVRAHWMRALLAELERVANHLFDIGAICNDAAFSLMLAECATLRETVLRANARCFGHRLLMDLVIPGGVVCDLTRETMALLKGLAADIRPRFAELELLYEESPSLLDRTVGAGVTPANLVHRFAAGGFVGRAASRGVDARHQPGYPPYDDLDVAVSVHAEGDVHHRVLVRMDEVRTSLGLIERIIDEMPGGPLFKPIPTRGGEGMALVEGFRGEILLWVRLSEVGRVVRCHPRDPSWFQWPLLEAAIEGNIVADFPLCNKSFNCSYSGPDL